MTGLSRRRDGCLSSIRRISTSPTSEERTLFDDLRKNRFGKAFRLEQESIGFDWVEEALTVLLPITSSVRTGSFL